MPRRIPSLLLRFGAFLSLGFFASIVLWNWFGKPSSEWAKSGDLAQHYGAAQLWKEGDLEGVYRNFQLGDWLNQWFQEMQFKNPDRIERFNYVYGPSIAAFGALFADLPWSAWLNIWALWILLCYAAAFVILWKNEPLIRGLGFPGFLLYFGFPSFYYAFIPLQNGPLTLLILASAGLLLSKNSPLSAGLVLSCAFYKPQLMPYLAFFALCCFQWRFALGICLGSAAWALLGLATCGLQAHLLWLESLKDMAAGIQFQRNAMSISLRGFFLTALPPGARPAIDLLSPLLSASLLILVAWKTRSLSKTLPWWRPQHSFYAGLVAWTIAIPYCGHYEILLGLPWWLLYIGQPHIRLSGILLGIAYWLISITSISGADLPVSVTALFTLPWLLATLWTLSPSKNRTKA